MKSESFETVLRSIIKSGLHLLLGDYERYEIYALSLKDLATVNLTHWIAEGFEFRPIQPDDLATSSHDGIRARAFYGGEGAEGFGVFKNGEVVSLQWFWHSDRYRLRNFWPLKAGEAKSVELFTLEAYRGLGVATALKTYSANEMQKKGYDRLLSRIWHSNYPSRRVNEKLGWSNIARVTVVYPFSIKVFKIRMVRDNKAGLR